MDIIKIDKKSTKFFLVALLFCGAIISSNAQEKINISIGYGLPELLNIGLRYQADQAQFGISYGFIPGYEENIFSISGDFYLHFAGSSELSERRPWYFRLGLAYLKDETSSRITKYTYFPLRIGRDFNFSKKIGTAIDLGVFFELSKNETMKGPTSSWWDFDLDYSILPSIGITLFYRI